MADSRIYKKLPAPQNVSSPVPASQTEKTAMQQTMTKFFELFRNKHS